MSIRWVMSTSGSESAARIYRITPWPTRIGAPLAALVVIAGLFHNGETAVLPIPIVLAATYIYLAERCGLVVTHNGVESRMTRRENRFRYRWSDVGGFELVDRGAQVPIVMRLPDGSRKLLPSTRA